MLILGVSEGIRSLRRGTVSPPGTSNLPLVCGEVTLVPAEQCERDREDYPETGHGNPQTPTPLNSQCPHSTWEHQAKTRQCSSSKRERKGTGALLASAQLLPFHSNKDKGLLGEGLLGTRQFIDP